MAVVDEKLSEAKQIEFLRRQDIAIATVRLASELFINQEKLIEALKVKLKKRENKWLWGFILLGSLISWIIGKDSNTFLNFGSFIVGICLLVYVANDIDIMYLYNQQDSNRAHILFALFQWETTGCFAKLYEVKRFIKDDCFDDESEEYFKWINKQYDKILWRTNDLT